MTHIANRVFCHKQSTGRICAFILLSETHIPLETINKVYRDVFCIIPEQDRKDCEWRKTADGIWKFSVLINVKDVAGKFRREVYLWKALVRINAKHALDFASFTLQ